MDTDESASESPDESADAFAALSDPTRVEILRALWDAEDHEATFSDLREEIGMRDSGQFNYHLGKLTGQFVRQTDDGTYELRLAGIQVIGSLLAGTYTGEAEIGPIPGEESCPDCGIEIMFEYDGDGFTFECESCETGTLVRMPAPRGVFEPYEEAETPGVAQRYARNVVREVTDGFCPFCRGPMTTVVDAGVPGEDPDDTDDPLPLVRFRCDRCEEPLQTELGTPLHDHPAVVAFYHDHGEDVFDLPTTRLLATDTDTAWLDSEEPFRATVRYRADGDTLDVTIDDSLDVIETARTDR
ncbi:MAG: ArsR/SmtB family transcription factor [Halobaculum sp.]